MPPTQAELELAEFIALDRIKDDFKQVADRAKARYDLLDQTYNIPDPIPKLDTLTDDQLDALLIATEGTLGMALIIENAAKFDVLKLDAEKMSRQP